MSKYIESVAQASREGGKAAQGDVATVQSHQQRQSEGKRRGPAGGRKGGAKSTVVRAGSRSPAKAQNRQRKKTQSSSPPKHGEWRTMEADALVHNPVDAKAEQVAPE